MFFQVRRRGRLQTPAWTESLAAPTVCSLLSLLRLLLTQMVTTSSRSVKVETKFLVTALQFTLGWITITTFHYFVVFSFVRIKIKWLLVSCAWWTWQEVSEPVGPGQRAPVYVKQVGYPHHHKWFYLSSEFLWDLTLFLPFRQHQSVFAESAHVHRNTSREPDMWYKQGKNS